jgi:hypothetical protein
MSPGAIAFLRQHSMDFQKWVYSGVPFVDRAGEQKLRDRYFPPEPEASAEQAVPDWKKRRITLDKQPDKEFVGSAMAALGGPRPS